MDNIKIKRLRELAEKILISAAYGGAFNDTRTAFRAAIVAEMSFAAAEALIHLVDEEASKYNHKLPRAVDGA